MKLVPIGIAKTIYKKRNDCPPSGWESAEKSDIEIFLKYSEGLKGLKRGMLIYVVWWFHEAKRNILQAKIGEASKLVGVFSMRSPERPNPIAISLCIIKKIKKNIITVKGLECLDRSVILDIKKVIFKNRLYL